MNIMLLGGLYMFACQQYFTAVVYFMGKRGKLSVDGGISQSLGVFADDTSGLGT
jgi:hypothetical protein